MVIKLIEVVFIVLDLKFFDMRVETLASIKIKEESVVITEAKSSVEYLKHFLMFLGFIFIFHGQYYKVGSVSIKARMERSFKTYTFEAGDSAQLVATLYTPAV